MKLRASKLLVVLLPGLLAAIGCLRVLGADPAVAGTPASDTPRPLGASPAPANVVNAPPDAAAAPTATPKPSKKPKKASDPNATPRPPKKPKDIPFPLKTGSHATDLVLPQNGLAGQLLSQIMAVKATRISNELVQMDEMKMDLYHPDGKEDFHIDLPTSIFNLQTHIISSEQPVSVHTDDFELTGEKMEFNTLDRTGKLLGHVHMHIRNLKQVAGPQPPPTP